MIQEFAYIGRFMVVTALLVREHTAEWPNVVHNLEPSNFSIPSDESTFNF